MNRILAVMRTRPGWCLSLWLAEVVLLGAEPATRSETPNTSSDAKSPQHLTLAEAQHIAFQRNWDLLAAKSGIDSATAAMIVAKEFPNPNFSWSTMKIDPHGNGTPLGNSIWDRSYDSIAAISELVEIGGKRHARQSSARAGVIGARARFLDARRSLNQGITKSYVAALLAAENARVLNESARSLRREADIAETRFKAGDISDSDRKQIENNADVFDLQAKSAEAAAVQARIAVEILMGEKEPKGGWIATDSLEQLGVNAPEAQSHPGSGIRPDVFAAEEDLRKTQSEVGLQKALRIPDPTFSLFYERNPPGPPGPDTLGLGVSFPLPLWNHNRGNVRAAEAAREQSAIALAKVSAQAQADIATAKVAYGEAQERSHRYQNQIQPRSAQVRESIAFAYSKGGASLVDLLTAERDDNNVRLAAAQALSDAASTAADLRAAQTVVSEAEMNQAK
jgi:cobalt-zinc-cadmium efflux system outer membrane protein